MNEQKRKKIMAVLKGIVFVIILAGIPLYLYFFHRNLIEMFQSVKDIETYLQSNKAYGFLIFIGAQTIQMIISVIPGQPFQFAAGYVYGIWIALLLSLIGAVIGESITFFLAKVLGRDAMNLFFGETKAVKYIDRLDTKNGFLILFLFYFIPGFPKDTVSYLAGLSKIKWAPFVIIATTARIIPMLGSICVGTFTKSEQYHLVILVAVIICILSFVSYRKKEKILDWSDRMYEKLKKL